ncbi:MAG: hypothetical protein H7201_07695 [Candidatus Saccharibacteria bacterium]|nr:hypothetical protein [Microbacteriaceae bacterium]
MLFPIGGFTELIARIEALAEAQGVTIVTDSPVTAINSRDGVVTGVDDTDATGTSRTLATDVVVSATDLHQRETALRPPALRSFPQEYWNRKVAGPSALLIYLGVRGELPQLEHRTLFFVRDWKGGFNQVLGKNLSIPDPACNYGCKLSGIDRATAPDGFENLLVLVPIPACGAIDKDDVGGDGGTRIETFADRVISQISVWAGIPHLASRCVAPSALVTSQLTSTRGSAPPPVPGTPSPAAPCSGPAIRAKKSSGCFTPVALRSPEGCVHSARGRTSVRGRTIDLVKPTSRRGKTPRGGGRNSRHEVLVLPGVGISPPR